MKRRHMANAEKVAAVAELTERFRGSSGAVLTEYRGLTVAQLAELRRSLGDNATFAVVKNTLTKIAVTEAGLSDQLSSLLVGPSAVAFVDGDVVEAAKGLRDFAKANPLLIIRGGVLDGRAISSAEIIKLADLEPRDVLLAKLAGAMKASLAGAAATFNALPPPPARPRPPRPRTRPPRPPRPRTRPPRPPRPRTRPPRPTKADPDPPKQLQGTRKPPPWRR
jgi:large subunit ribosomal protein L10